MASSNAFVLALGGHNDAQLRLILARAGLQSFASLIVSLGRDPLTARLVSHLDASLLDANRSHVSRQGEYKPLMNTRRRPLIIRFRDSLLKMDRWSDFAHESDADRANLLAQLSRTAYNHGTICTQPDDEVPRDTETRRRHYDHENADETVTLVSAAASSASPRLVFLVSESRKNTCTPGCWCQSVQAHSVFVALAPVNGGVECARLFTLMFDSGYEGGRLWMPSADESVRLAAALRVRVDQLGVLARFACCAANVKGHGSWVWNALEAVHAAGKASNDQLLEGFDEFDEYDGRQLTDEQRVSELAGSEAVHAFPALRGFAPPTQDPSREGEGFNMRKYLQADSPRRVLTHARVWLSRALAHGAAVSLRKLLCATRGFHGEVRGLVDASYPPRMTPLGNDVPEEEESEHDDDY